MALLLTLVLTGSLAQALAAPPAAATPSSKKVVRDWPIMASTSSPTTSRQALEPEQPAADFTPLSGGGTTDGRARVDPEVVQQRGAAGVSSRHTAADSSVVPEPSLVAPVDQAVLATEMPTLQVAAVGDGVQYCFKVATGFDGRSGSVVDSGCLSTPSWTVPRYVLHDGGRYSWTVATAPAGGQSTTPAKWVGHFTVNQRVGDPGPSPSDRLGPVTVNLFSGNLHTAAAGPAFPTLGGSAGVTFAYNSRQGEPRGVRASYFNDSRHAGVPDDAPVMVRGEPQVNMGLFLDPQANFPWQQYTWPPALAKDWFVIRWEGQFKPPVSGDFRFGGAHADGARIWVNNTLVYDNPNAAELDADFYRPGPKQDRELTLTADQAVPIKVELYHRSQERPKMVLWAKSTIGPDMARGFNYAPRIVPTELLLSAD
ncbi:PA14 domain-containing protein, partial [Kitasatospora sp. NPDC093558]|uniref:PA14 domain-containing protein n=1 Tax=Kitasatospora sp. NPDC093558 TaxID=3155201 RepID=UPI0034285641